MWILIMSIMYNTPNGDMIKYETVDQFKSEKACMSFKSIQDTHFKKIKSQTNIKSWDMTCYKGEKYVKSIRRSMSANKSDKV